MKRYRVIIIVNGNVLYDYVSGDSFYIDAGNNLIIYKNQERVASYSAGIWVSINEELAF